MTKLDPRERQKLINIIASIPEMQSDRGRREILEQAGLSEFLSRIDFAGSTGIVAGNIITVLVNYGANDKGEAVLGLLLNLIKGYVGFEQKVFLNQLLEITNVEKQNKSTANYQKEYDQFMLSSDKRDTLSNSVSKQTSSQNSDRSSIDLGIIIALEEEFEVLYEQLASPISIKDEQTGNYDYLFQWPLENNSSSYSCAATFFSDMGPSKAALACERFLARRQPETIVMLGIAGGLNTDVQLGDVVLVTMVNLYLERSKAIEGQETFEIKPGGDFYRCSDDLVQASSNLKFAHSNLYRQWQTDSQEVLDKLIPSQRLNQLLSAEWVREKPSIIKGSVASGPVVGASEKFTSWLKKTNRNYLALEMEVGGLLSAVYSQADPKKTLILRGISDFGDSRKKELDEIGKGGIRRYAMNNATRLLWKLLEGEVLPQSLEKKKNNYKIQNLKI